MRERRYAVQRRIAHAGRDGSERGPPLSFSPSSPKRVSRRLADVIVSGPWRVEDAIERGHLALGRRRRWLGPLIHRLFAAIGSGTRPGSRRVSDLVMSDPKFLRACGRTRIGLDRVPFARPAMWPAPGAPSEWLLPPITTTADLAEFLRIGMAELLWLADPQGRERRSKPTEPRRHAYRWIAKRSGSRRLVEIPCGRLRHVQGRLLREVLDPIPAHDSAHGFRPRRSIRTYAAPHVGRSVVLKLDLLDFFPSIGSSRVTALFLSCGYPEPVARLLSALCSNAAPSDVWARREAPSPCEGTSRSRRLLQRPHLPQGAPTSPALANLCAYRLDARLSGLASASGGTYTRYADDLAFSGDPAFARTIERFHVHACAIALEEGFRVNTRKTRIMRRGVCQRIAGVVVNEKVNVPRADYEALKATIHNCVVHGPSAQDRSGVTDFRAHLLGRIAHVGSLHPDRGRKLRGEFARIAW